MKHIRFRCAAALLLAATGAALAVAARAWVPDSASQVPVAGDSARRYDVRP